MKAIFANAIASGIENNVTRYEFATEAETEAAVLECIGNGIKFNTVGRCALVVYQPAPETTEPTTNTPSTMDTNVTISAAIIAELNTRKDRSAWDKGVTEYATELAESLDGWDKQPESVAELCEMILDGAGDWGAYSWGGSSLICNQDIAERLCSPSELKRATNKNGLRDYPNSRERWDIQARALDQAWRRIVPIAAKYLSK